MSDFVVVVVYNATVDAAHASRGVVSEIGDGAEQIDGRGRQRSSHRGSCMGQEFQRSDGFGVTELPC